MNRIARFEKVSFEVFLRDMSLNFPVDDTQDIYDRLRLPERATVGSAGYDFFLPIGISLAAGETVTIPTGVRAYIEEGWFLMCCPRSGLGFRYRLRLDNTVGIIDSDYYFSENEGHIIIRITNENTSGKVLTLSAGKAFAQGIFIPYGITLDDKAEEIRRGGFGSSG